MSSPIEQIKERLDIVEVLGSYMKLDKAGQNYKARCPFHNEKTPSFMVSPSRQSFYCFGCQAKGDIFTFVEKFEGLDFRGALKLLADRAGVELKKIEPEEEEKRDMLSKIVEKSALFFERNLQENTSAKNYLEQRGVTSVAVAKWRIGFAKDEWRSLYDFLLKEGFSREDMLATGMIKKVENEEKYYDTFRNRVMFPIFDTSGRVIAFSGRSLSNDEKSPKYLNSPETELFKKSEVLYGLNFAKGAIRQLDYAILVEGQMDLVLSHEAGITNTVASSGTALTSLHLERLRKISNRLIFAYDGDDAGWKASRRGLELALLLGMEVKIAHFPEGKDPADIAKESPELLKKSLREAKDGIVLVLHQNVKGMARGVALAKKINSEVLPLIALVQNSMVQSQYVTLVSKETGIPEQAIQSELGKQKTSKEIPAEREMAQIVEKSILSPEEMLAGYILLKHDEKLKKKFDELLGETVFREITENGTMDKDSLMFEAERIFETGGGGEEQMGKELFLRIEKKTLKKKIEALAERLDTETDEGKKVEIQKQMNDIIKQIA